MYKKLSILDIDHTSIYYIFTIFLLFLFEVINIYIQRNSIFMQDFQDE